MIYMNNQKHEKAFKLLNQLINLLKVSQPYSAGHVFVMKRLYICTIALDRIKDGELILRNVIEAMHSSIAVAEGTF